MARSYKRKIDLDEDKDNLSASDVDSIEYLDCSLDEDEFDVENIENPEALLPEVLLQELALEEENGNDEESFQTEELTWLECNGRQQNFSYTGNGGIVGTYNPNVTPKEIYLDIVDSQVISYIVNETNKYAIQMEELRKERNIKRPPWKPTYDEEIIKFLALNIWMELDRRDTIASYWSTKFIYKNEIATNTMSRNRFQELMCNIYFGKNEIITKDDRLGKIQPLIDLIQKRYQTLYIPEEDIVIDQTLVPWRGQLIFHQYLPEKARKYGIKFFKLSSSTGYVWSMKIYGGNTGEREVDQIEKVCKELSENLRNEGRTLYIDNFYTSYQLAKYFLEQKTHIVGTLGTNKLSLPISVIKAHLRRGEAIAREDQNGIMVLKWQDIKEVRLISTKHGPEMTDIQRRNTNISIVPSTSRYSDSQRVKVKKKPVVVVAYEKGRISIIQSDQDSSVVTSLRKSIKWYRKLAFEILLGISIINAYLIFRSVSFRKIGLREFKEEIVESLLDLPSSQKHSEPVGIKQHILKQVENKVAKARRRCVRCYSTISKSEGREVAIKKAKQVYTYCEQCPQNPFFCLVCFGEHHKN